MLHYQEKETLDIAPVNFNIKAMVKADSENLAYLQKQRTKANQKRKHVYQEKIDAHFFG